jgi:hypothetical protein
MLLERGVARVLGRNAAVTRSVLGGAGELPPPERDDRDPAAAVA